MVPCMQVSRGKQRDHTLADHTRSSKCSTLHAVSDHAGWWDLTAPSKSWRCLSTPVSKGKRFSHQSCKRGAPRHAVRCGEGCSVWTLRANSCVWHPKHRVCNTLTGKGNKNPVNTWERNRSPGNPAQPISLPCCCYPSVLVVPCKCCRLWPLAQLIMLHQAHSAPLIPLYQLWVTLYFSRYWTHCKLFFTQPVTILVRLPSSHLSSSHHWLANSSKRLLRLEDGWQHLPSEACTHQE